MGNECMEVTAEHPVTIIRLNRPEKRNALSLKLRGEMVDCLKSLEEDPKTSAVLLTGNGPAFCAGFDLGEFQNPDPANIEAIKKSSQAFHGAIMRFPKPLLAAANGPAMAGGFDLALMCDIRVASDKALFGHPELRFGSPLLYKLLKEVAGGGVARDLCLTGRTIDAKEAHRMGIVSSVTSPSGLLEAAQGVLSEICKTPLFALMREKRRMVEAASEAVEEATADEGQSFVDIIREGMKK
jgi:enoyl-CoA hydratase/carnithine racemase